MENTATLPGGRTVPQRCVQAAESLAAALTEAGLALSAHSDYLAWTEAWADANGYRAVTVFDPARYGELHVPGSLVLEGGQAWMALETADGVPWMVDAGGALSFLPSWEDYELSGEHRVTFFSPAA